jgi:phage tail sheath protein FI
VTALLDLCQNYRMDCLAIIDPPFGLTVNEIIALAERHPPAEHDPVRQRLRCLYWPWVKIRDNFNRVDVWVPPSGSVMATIARSDNFGPVVRPGRREPWQVPGITDVFSRPTLAERDLMYGNRNCINPIVQFADLERVRGLGSEDAPAAPTALDRVNVRRLMFYIEKRIRAASRQLLFDPHDEQFRQKFVRSPAAS